MAYQEITQYNSPNYTPNSQVRSVYGMPRTIDGVTYHWWGDPAQKPQFMGIINWLCRANGNSSAHTVGEGGRVAWIVDAVHAAWHAGNARGNATTVGYECNPRLWDSDYETMGEFHYDMEKAYGKRLAIYVHKEWSATSCSPIDKSRIRAIADRYHNGGGAKPTVTEAQIREVFRSILGRDVDADGLRHYLSQASKGWTIEQIRNDVNNSQEAKQRREMLARQAEELKKSEWQRNLKDIEDVKLTVLAADGARVLNLTNLQFVNDTIIPRGTQVDIAKETTVGGTKYYLSSYAVTKGLPWGIPADKLGVPAAEPEKEKPEWLKNLKDIEDKDMWTRSETPVLNIENGDVVNRLPVNTKVRITHATQIVGKDLLVVEGGKTVIETLYLSDKEISSPNDDLEKRVGALEKIVNKIVEFLTSLFKGFNK